MAQINLLPQDLVPKDKNIKFAKMLQKSVMVASFIFLFLVGAAIAALYTINSRLSQSQQRQARLLASIDALSDTEKELYLVKDRVERSGSILAAQKVTTADTISKVVGVLVTGTSIDSVDTKGQSVVVTVAASGSDSLVQFLAGLAASGLQKVTLSNLNLVSGAGYKITLALDN